ncbi:MAG TPA: hypothetical protein VN633_09915 [Bryobacteraceae bacterium]|nr:hypothetical protein [Bryobacteraceae bacterium]
MGMISGKTKALLALWTGGAFLAGLVAIGLPFSKTAAANGEDNWLTFTVEVYEDGSKYKQVNVDPNQGQKDFYPGDISYIEGVLYPKGTLHRGKSDPPPNAQTIGTYRYRGVNTGSLQDFIHAQQHQTAPRVLAFMTETYGFPDDDSEIITEGAWPNAYHAVHRAVIGGTGRFAGVVGEAWEENIGENTRPNDGNCNLRTTFKLRRMNWDHR